MEWSRSNISAEELERRQREYIEAAMNMAKKAMPSPKTVHISQPEPVPAEEPETASEPETNPASEPEITLQSEAEPEPQPEPPEEQTPASEKEPESGECAEECEADEEKTKFGVFGKDELLEAAEKGTVSDEGLKRAAEILAEMSSKTEIMRQILEQSEEKCEKNTSEQPQTLNSYVNRHNGGSCPRCGQVHNGNHR